VYVIIVFKGVKKVKLYNNEELILFTYTHIFLSITRSVIMTVLFYICIETKLR